MESVHDVQSSFLDMQHSTTAGHLPLSVLELSSSETWTSASQLEVLLQATLIEEFVGNYYIFERSASRIADEELTKMFPDNSTPHPLTVKRRYHPSSRITCVLSRTQKWLLWILKTPSRIKHPSSGHRNLHTNSSFAVCRCRSSNRHLLNNCRCYEDIPSKHPFWSNPRLE
jgi:hypothetical protein